MEIMSHKYESQKIFARNISEFPLTLCIFWHSKKSWLTVFDYFFYNNVLIIPVVDADLFGFRLYYYLRWTETKFKKLLHCSVKDIYAPILIYKHSLPLSLSQTHFLNLKHQF